MLKKLTFVKYLMLLAVFSGLSADTAFADDRDLNPALVEVVEEIRSRAEAHTSEQPLELRTGSVSDPSVMELILSVQNIHEITYRKNSIDLRQKVDEFRIDSEKKASNLNVEVSQIFEAYTEALEQNLTHEDILKTVKTYTTDGHWFVRFTALRLSSNLHSQNLERQPALQDAQNALSIIPEDNSVLPYYAKTRVVELIAQLHNLQNNPKLAIAASKEFLDLTKNDFKPEASLDLLNNLLFSHSNWRDHETQKYLASEILELETKISSSIPGLTELRIARAFNDSQNFRYAMDFAKQSYEKSAHPSVIKQARQAEAIALAGLGDTDQSKAIAKEIDLAFSFEEVMSSDSSDSLYLGYLLALNEGDRATAIALYNRRLDVASQKLLSASSRDTSSMLASLENSRERQAERAAAAEREALLQAQKIDKQRKLNRALTILVVLLAIASSAMLVFLKYREKIMKALAIKTEEAASADKLKTEFLGLISHELRTPLNGIIGFSDILSRTHQDPDVRQKSSIILESGHDLLSIIEAMTDMARIDANRMEVLPEETNVSELLTEVASSFEPKAKSKKLVFTAYVDPALSEHRVDGPRLRQCVETLLSNAVSFTGRGRVHLHATAQTSEAGEVTGLKLIVADTGLGMTDLVQSRLFTPFMQADTSIKRKHQGAGLSLAIARALARLMGGDITVLSRESRGSEFTLTVTLAPVERQIVEASDNRPVAVDADKTDTQKLALPAPIIDLMQPQTKERSAPLYNAFSTTASGERAHILKGPSNPLANLHILIVGSNDEPLRARIERAGCHSIAVADGEAALTALDAAAFDIVILDSQNHDIDPANLTRRIRAAEANFADIPIIALSAEAVPDQHAACLAAGVDIFLTKPVAMKELADALTFLLGDTPADNFKSAVA